MKYRLIIFDFDGTLADSFPYFLSIANVLADKYEYPRLEESQIETLRGMDPSQLIKLSGLPKWKIAQVAGSAMKLMQENIHKIVLFPGMETVLQRLSELGATLALVSSNSCENVRKVLGPENSARISHFECGVALLGKAAKFRKILRASRIPAGETISIGDEIRDIEAARKVRIACGAVAWGYANPQALIARSPDEVFSHFDEILQKLV
jgi:phosphoglycolate phosphatase